MTRPQFHFTAPTGWINDPHGIVVRDGEAHLFYQYVPDSMIWGPECHWGHASGPDLLSLEHRPVALAPGDGDDGVWTGSLVPDEERGDRIFYTSVQRPALGMGRIRSATPTTGDWTAWSKGPVVASPPEDLPLTAFRDPFVLRDGEGWSMLVGAALADGTAAALRYSSPDLERWRYEGVAAQRSTTETDPVWTGALWECPQLFELDGRAVLVTSVWDGDVLHHAAYGIGTWNGGRFTAQTWGRLSFGGSYYAPSFFRDAAGRPCLLLWMRGVRDEREEWCGAHSVPHLLTLDGDRLVATPHPDLDRYLGEPLALGAGTPGALDVRWRPQPEDELVVTGAGTRILRVHVEGDVLVLFGAGDAWPMPYGGGEVRLLVDGPTAELSTSEGILGSPVSAPTGPLRVTARWSEPIVRPLRR